MRVIKKYSHLNGEEFMLVRKKSLYEEIFHAINLVDASKFLTKASEEKGRQGVMLYNPDEINKEFKRIFEGLGWAPHTRHYFVSDNYSIVKVIESMTLQDQREHLEQTGEPLIRSYNQIDFIKEQVAVEIQLGKYFAVTYDLFVKHLSFYTGGIIDVGIEILPSRTMHERMSSGPPFFEKEVHNVMRHGRTTPPVPLVILAIDP
jgi:hypothetical protein